MTSLLPFPDDMPSSIRKFTCFCRPVSAGLHKRLPLSGSTLAQAAVGSRGSESDEDGGQKKTRIRLNKSCVSLKQSYFYTLEKKKCNVGQIPALQSQSCSAS
ncbi:hypothetical protein ATANTOWER_021333 [Ataeniobius toweri]|uniref:Uncharacterized protein n=1 Tax=Ataeniobius toweri TaxID=208326 RepID=A0ABU7BHV7_9TELE|nr:hypothetical protein [Ataeniobius toweri]